jgi:anti-anti-sigma factor
MLKPSVQIHNEDGILIAEFWDCLRMDPTPVQELRKHYEAHVRGGGRPELVVDLSGVGFAGSSALGSFVSLHRLARQHNGRLIFCDVEPTVWEVFRASKLDSLFEFVADRAAARQAVLAGPPSRPLREEAPDSADTRNEASAASPASTSASASSAGGGTGIGRFRRRNQGTDSPAR